MFNALKDNIPGKKNSLYNIAIYVIIGLGILFRAYHYFDNRSLWEDEIYLSTGLVKLSIPELFTKTLDFQQKAPMGYAMMAKLCIILFGQKEMALRLYPFICGCAALFFFVPVAKYFLKPAGVLVALALLALTPTMIYHTVEAKQYVTEMLATILILLFYTRYHDKTDRISLIKWALSGVIIVWFSYSSIFILVGVAFTAGLRLLIKKEWGLLVKLSLVFIAWFASFVIYYLIFTIKDAHTPWLVWFFENHDAFMPHSGAAVAWLVHRFIAFYNYPMGLSWEVIYAAKTVFMQMLIRMVFIPILFTIAGIIYLYKTNRKLLLLIVSILGIVLLASAIKQYPFHERLTVFLTPLVILLLAAGCEFFFQKSLSKPVWPCILVLLLLLGPIKNDIAQTLNPGLFGDYKKSYQREALTMINNNIMPGDLVYVYWNDLPGYRFYKNVYHFKFTAIEGKDHRFEVNNFNDYFVKLDRDFSELIGHKRVWIVNNKGIDIVIGEFIGDPAYYYKKNDGPQRFMEHISGMGRELEHFEPSLNNETDISVRLMDFSKK